MKTKLSPWSKSVKKELIERDMSIKDVADELGMAREYVSAVINGRVYSESAVKKISNLLNVEDDDNTLRAI